MKTIVLVATFALAAAAQQVRPRVILREVKLYDDGVVIGTVTNTRGEPLPGAWVTLQGYTRGEKPDRVFRHAAADASGRVRFANLPTGRYSLDGRMAGRSPQRGMEFDRRGALEGPKAELRLNLVLPRKPVLTGRVFDEAGVPLVRARVHTFRRKQLHGEELFVPATSDSTDDRGIYRIVLEEAGKYWLMASHSERSFPRGSAPRSTGIAFYPNAPDLAGAAPVEVAFDQEERTLDVTLPDAPPTMLTVAIATGPAGKPCLSCRYSLRKVEEPFEYEIVGGTTRSRPGFDHAGIPAGLYRIYVSDDGANEGWWGVGEAVVAEGRPAEALVATQPPIPVSGKVILDDLPEERRPSRPGISETIHINLEPNGSERTFQMRGPLRTSAQLSFDDDAFSLGPLPPGRYRMRVWVQGPQAYLASISRQGRPLASPILDLSQPGPWTDLQLHVRFDLARVKISIERAGTEPEAAYRLVVEPDRESNPFGQESDRNCIPRRPCFFGSLPPGRYRAVAIEQGGPVRHDIQDPKTWEALSPWVRTFTVTPGENPDVHLTPAPEQ